MCLSTKTESPLGTKNLEEGKASPVTQRKIQSPHSAFSPVSRHNSPTSPSSFSGQKAKLSDLRLPENQFLRMKLFPVVTQPCLNEVVVRDCPSPCCFFSIHEDKKMSDAQLYTTGRITNDRRERPASVQNNFKSQSTGSCESPAESMFESSLDKSPT